MLSIGKTAHLVGLTAKAIKYYEEIGLVQPAYVSPDSGYRFYSQKEQQQLVRIRTLRNFGGVPFRHSARGGRTDGTIVDQPEKGNRERNQ